jgi:aspartyl-tRNA(Asn)/glutamyl-tRNA(Gln) amidotransferase subunit A
VSGAIHRWTARQTRQAIRSGETSAAEVARALLDRIARLDAPGAAGGLGAFLHVDPDRVLARAAALDAEIGTAADRPLFGVPVAVKDNLCTRDVPTTAASRILERFVPPYSATAVERLEAAGAIVIGKTNCDEFAMGSSTENSALGVTRNPWATDRIPGGSSGGSAVAVAAGLAPISLGSDTGGSIRQPGALCGVVGFKPTYGRVSRYGLLAFGSSLDQVGPFARTVQDAADVFAAMAGPDDADATTAHAPVPDVSALDASAGDASGIGRSGASSTPLAGRRIGVPRALLGDGVDAAVRAAIDAALTVLERLGATLVDVALPHASAAIPVYYLVATAEASSNLARYDGVRYTTRARLAPGDDLATLYERTRGEHFGPEVKRRIMLGTYVLSAGYYEAYYLKAQRVRTLIRRDYDTAFADVEAIAMPTCPTPAFRLGERAGDPLQMYLADVFTVSANLTGLPAISVPCGFSPERLPIGLQLTGRPFDEAGLLRIAHAYEAATEWHREAPPVG